MDRAVRKLLSLPLFGDEDREAAQLLGLSSIEKIVCFDVSEADLFAEKVVFLAPSLCPKQGDKPCLRSLELVARAAPPTTGSAMGAGVPWSGTVHGRYGLSARFWSRRLGP